MSASLGNLLSTASAPPLIYLHHPHHTTTSLPAPPPNCLVARLDAIEHHTPRLLLSGILNKLTGGEGKGEVNSWDGLSLGLKEWWSEKQAKGKGARRKANGHQAGGDECVVVWINHAERLKAVLGNGWSAVTRLPGLTGVPCTVVLASTAPWDHVRPHRADVPEPVHVYLPSPSRQEILSTLLPASPHPLWPRFIDFLLATILPLVTPPVAEIHYLSLSLWPLYTSSLPPHAEMTLLSLPYPDPSTPPPPLEITVKLLTELKHALNLPLAAAIENLVTRQTGQYEFTQAMTPAPGKARTLPKLPGLEVPLAARFLLVAAYCASYNPASTDVRLFGRGTGPDGKRLRGGGMRRAGYGKARVGKVPQRLLGPKPFALDRLLAMFASLYAEHAPRPADLLPTIGGDSSSEDESDVEMERTWPPTVAQQAAKMDRRQKKDREREERWDEEVERLMMSVRFWGMIPELEAQGLMKRVSPVDRLDNVMLRCEVDYETAKSLAKELRVTIDEYLYEATM
ncbi:hypothetical protein IAT38_002860 [Cryptococcus sp. DSM 104549]